MQGCREAKTPLLIEGVLSDGITKEEELFVYSRLREVLDVLLRSDIKPYTCHDDWAFDTVQDLSALLKVSQGRAGLTIDRVSDLLNLFLSSPVSGARDFLVN